MRKLTKSNNDVVISGVLGGIAEYFGFDSQLLRIIFSLGTLASFGSGILLYIILAMLMPREG